MLSGGRFTSAEGVVVWRGVVQENFYPRMVQKELILLP